LGRVIFLGVRTSNHMPLSNCKFSLFWTLRQAAGLEIF
jgi:hypothetical protein